MSPYILCVAIFLFWEVPVDAPIHVDVAHTALVLNRIVDSRYGNDPCAVVFETDASGNCEFKFACDKVSDAMDKDPLRRDQKVQISAALLHSTWRDPTGGATHVFKRTPVSGIHGTFKQRLRMGDLTYYVLIPPQKEGA